MADTTFGTGAAEAVKRWSGVLVVELPRHIYWAKLMKENTPETVIEVKRDLQKNPGDRIRFTLLRKLAGAGVSGDTQMEGAEEALVYYSDDVTIDQRRNAVRLAGRMTERRVAFNLRMDAKNTLRTWMAETIDDDIFSGFALSPAASRTLYAAGRTSVAGLTAADTIGVALIDRLQGIAKKATPKLWPTRVDGMDLFVLLMHTDVSYDLRQTFSTTATGWASIQQYAGVRDKSNPMFLGSLGFWGGQCVLHEHEKVPIATDGGAGGDVPWASNMFLGRQAGCFAWGAQAEAWEKEFDYGARHGFCVGAIWGFKKSVFNAVDHGYIELRTARTNL